MRLMIFRFAPAIPIVFALCGAPPSQALSMSTFPQSIAQIGNGSTAVSLGHTVYARTPMNRLYAGGTFSASCVSEYTGSITGQRGLPSNLIGELNVLYVTIPEWLPATLNMPGFENVPSGSVLSCTYAWTSRAVEGTYTVGVPGFSTTLGGEELNSGGTIGFYMYKTDGDGDPGHGCVH